MITTILSLGNNLGDRKKNIESMVALLENTLKSPVKLSQLMETEPVGVPVDQEWFYNMIILGRYDGSAESLLEACQNIETTLGRSKKNTYEARTADIDILLIDNCIIKTDSLTVPHPQILKRRFCIEGILSIAPDWIHPIEGRSFSELYEDMSSDIRKQKIRLI
jgi:2-amino-4-hydroxy-6-hydroxymethyldihydropteridine diphosphokinase